MNLIPHHPRTPPYMPDDDAGVRSHIVNLASQVELYGPEAFGLTADDLALIIARRDAYDTAYSIAKNPISATKPNVQAKNEARDEADRVCRMYAQVIKANPEVPNGSKVLARVHIDKETRTPKGRPRTFPLINIIANFPGVTEIRFRDVGLSTGRVPREDGITHLILHAEVAPNGEFTRKESALRVIAHVTRNPHRVMFEAKLLNRFGLLDTPGPFRALYRGQWLSAKGDVGPIGPPISFTVPLSRSAFAAQKATGAQDRAPMKLAA